MENNNNVLEIRGLNSYFFTEKGVAPAVDGLDLDIPKGKIIGLESFADFSELKFR